MSLLVLHWQGEPLTLTWQKLVRATQSDILKQFFKGHEIQGEEVHFHKYPGIGSQLPDYSYYDLYGWSAVNSKTGILSHISIITSVPETSDAMPP